MPRRRWPKPTRERLTTEKDDLPAMLLAALCTLLPAVLLVGAGFTLAIWMLFLR